ncbi:MAG: AAA family ATPase, partial [Bdellovibrionota bacterium]
MDSSDRLPSGLLTPFSDLFSTKPAHLWWPYVPRDCFVVLEGDPGAGKTWIATDLAADVSRGDLYRGPEGHSQGKPGKVLYLDLRDDWASVLRPRLEAAGADLTRVFWVEGPGVIYEDEDGRETIDLDTVARMLERHKPDLLVIDPIDLYVGKKAGNLSRDLAALARNYHCTILAVRRVPRTPSGRPARGNPEDLSYWADSVVLCGKDPEETGKRVVAHERCTHEAEGDSIQFEIKEGRLEWGDFKEITADEFLFPVKEAAERPSALKEAREFLQTALEERRQEAVEILKTAALEGIRKKTLLRAKKALGVKSVREISFWYWELPKPEKEDAKKDGQLGHLDGKPP